MKLTRTYRFAASHRLHSEQLTEEANRELYGKCNHPYGHGHDYVLRITVHGPVSAETGRVLNPGKLDQFVDERILRVFDHKDMNTDVPDIRGVPTTEILALEIGRRLQDGWDDRFAPATLDGIWLQETPRNTFELRLR